MLSWLTKKRWQRAAERAQRELAADRFADAWRSADEALESCPPEEKAAMLAVQQKAAETLVPVNVEHARGLTRAGEYERAAEHIQIAASFAGKGPLRHLVDDALKNIQTIRASAPAPDTTDPLDDPTPEIPAENDGLTPIDMVHPSFPDPVLDAYASAPSRWRRAVIAMHQQGNIDLAQFEVELKRKDTSIARFELAMAQVRSRNLVGARATLEQGIDLRPTWPEYLLALAEIATALGESALAEQALQDAADHYPDNLPVLVAVARHSLQQGDTASAREALEAANEAYPQTPAVVSMLWGEVFDREGKVDRAVVEFEKVVAATWRVDFGGGRITVNSDAAYGAALGYLKLKSNLKRALQLLTVLREGADEGEYWRIDLDIVAVLRANGDVGKAESLLESLEDSIPSNRTLARMRWLELAGRDDELETMLSNADENTRALWALASRQRGTDG
jgi:tetratricopeptide (TPR) repeat protein